MFGLLLTALLVHPSHESFSEVEWNAETGRLEVALRFDSLDEQWLRRQRKNQTLTSDWPLKYVQSNYRMAELPDKGKPDSTQYRWVGREEDGPHVWWYFEIEPADGQPPQWLDVRVLFEREKNYTHQFVRLDLKPRYSKILTVLKSRGSFLPRDKQTVDGSKLSNPAPNQQTTADR
ncbi:MAG: DUF6702 family protein [Planctomycetota bacterium]